MTFNFRTVSILAASALAVLMIGAAYIVSGDMSFINGANAGTTDDALKAFASKDTDSDGLPDWQESLYGTNPSDAHSVDKTLTDKEAVDKGLVKPKFTSTVASTAPSEIPGAPAGDGTLTDLFAQKFLSQYLLTQNVENPSTADLQNFVDTAVNQLRKEQALTDAYSQSDIKVSGTGATSLKTYAVQTEQVYAAIPVPERDQILYFYDGIVKNDTNALKQVGVIGAGYTAAAKALAKIPVPTELSAGHLGLINAMAEMGKAGADMASYATDPLRALLGLGEYQDASKSLATALQNLGTVYANEQVVLTQGQPGYFFYNAVATFAPAPKTP